MASIVAVHGIGQQFKGSHTLHADFLPALRDGLDRAGMDFPNPDDLICAFYGDLFRKKGTKSLSAPPYDATDVDKEFEQDLLELWCRGAAQSEPQVPGPDSQTKLRTPNIVQRALNALSKEKFFAGLAERAMIGDLKQVRSYLEDQVTRRNHVNSIAIGMLYGRSTIVSGSWGGTLRVWDNKLNTVIDCDSSVNNVQFGLDTMLVVLTSKGVMMWQLFLWRYFRDSCVPI